MSGHRKWSELREKMMDRPGAEEGLERARAELDEEIRLYELRNAEALKLAEQVVGVGLHAGQDVLVGLDGRPGLPGREHIDGCRVEVDVGPAESEEFAPASPGRSFLL